MTITSNNPSANGGAITSFSVSPALPAGLNVSTSNGIISGTPTVIATTASYVVTASNSGGSTTATVTITVNDVAPTALAYTNNPAVYTRGLTITPNNPSADGGAITSFSVSPTLPAGLTLSNTSGIISGTPTAITPIASYTVAASNSGGSATTNLTITVNDAPPAMPVVNLSAYVTTAKAGLMAGTQDQGTGMAYSWALSGGTITSGQGTPTITFSAGPVGTLAASVTVTNSVGSTSNSNSATIVSLPNAELALPYVVHPGDGWMQARVPVQTGMVYQWTVIPGTSSASITSGQGSGVIGFAADSNEGAFQIQVNVQNQAGDHVTASQNIVAQKETWLVNNEGPSTTREKATSTLLPSGRVLIVGGAVSSGTSSVTLASAELFDPATGTWTPTGSMGMARVFHTATLLLNGKVLVAGGGTANAEIYDPTSGTWAPTGSMGAARSYHAATLLLNGKVLVAGNSTNAEIYDPATGVWTPTTALDSTRTYLTATLLSNGKVLVAGGLSAVVEIYDPATGFWSRTGNLITARYFHTATLLSNGKVLIAGGRVSGGSTASAEIYDPTTGIWSAAGGLSSALSYHTATLLPNSKVLVAGGYEYLNGYVFFNADIFDPSTGAWAPTGNLKTRRYAHTATLLPNGKLFVAGGHKLTNTTSHESFSSAEIYDPATGVWAFSGSLGTSRERHSATLLPNGKVLAVGGFSSSRGFEDLTSTELYDPSARTWTPTGSLGVGRYVHTATLFPNGKVLVVGGLGSSGTLTSAEMYDPATAVWSLTASLVTARANHTATLLSNGKVLVVGGSGNTSAEIYDPILGSWILTGSLGSARSFHTATLLLNGKVLVTGGSGTATSEIYDPTTGSWTPTGDMGTARYYHSATLLSNGKVLVVGGWGNNTALANAEVYDPATGTWTPTGSLGRGCFRHTTTLLPNGKVLVAGGWDSLATLANVEIFDPSTETWTRTGNLGALRERHTATLLNDGTVLLAFGYECDTVTEIYMPK